MDTGALRGSQDGPQRLMNLLNEEAHKMEAQLEMDLQPYLDEEEKEKSDEKARRKQRWTKIMQHQQEALLEQEQALKAEEQELERVEREEAFVAQEKAAQEEQKVENSACAGAQTTM